jgi:hypothetical protein
MLGYLIAIAHHLDGLLGPILDQLKSGLTSAPRLPQAWCEARLDIRQRTRAGLSAAL